VRDLRRILCPVDRSEPSRLALAHAAAVAVRRGAAITVLEVLDRPAPVVSGAGPYAPPMAATDRDDLLALLEAFVSPVRAAGVAVETRVSEGHVVSEIVSAAGELPADLLVAGTHGRSGFERLLIGSVAEKLLQRIVCPMLTVPPGAASPASPPFRHILCATDFSDAASDAFDEALHLARDAGADLLLVHVLEWPLGTVPGGDDAVSRLHRSLEDEARGQLDALADRARAEGVRCETLVRTGRPKGEVPEIAASRGVDLIVVGATGRGAVQTALVGSTAAHVVRAAGCPVLTVPPCPDTP
jgi:nucleotide-binding universal stress UspA family protein